MTGTNVSISRTFSFSNAGFLFWIYLWIENSRRRSKTILNQLRMIIVDDNFFFFRNLIKAQDTRVTFECHSLSVRGGSAPKY